MNNLQLLSFRFSQPIERIRGGPICIALHCEFKINEQFLHIPGYAFCNEEKEVDNAIKEAINNAINNTSLVSMEERESNLSNVIKTLMKIDYNIAKTKLTDGKEELLKIEEPVGKEKQTVVTELCSLLGINRINILSPVPFTNMEAMVLIEVLKNKASKLTKK